LAFKNIPIQAENRLQLLLVRSIRVVTTNSVSHDWFAESNTTQNRSFQTVLLSSQSLA